jgi:hypothetical protein
VRLELTAGNKERDLPLPLGASRIPAIMILSTTMCKGREPACVIHVENWTLETPGMDAVDPRC